LESEKVGRGERFGRFLLHSIKKLNFGMGALVKF
jgi:hypothetical protein